MFSLIMPKSINVIFVSIGFLPIREKTERALKSYSLQNQNLIELMLYYLFHEYSDPSHEFSNR